MADVHPALPLLHKQERRLLIDELRTIRTKSVLAPQSQFSIAFEGDGAVNRSALRGALRALILRHAALRTAFVPSDRVSPEDRRMQLETFARTGLFVPGLFEQLVYEQCEVAWTEWRSNGDAEEINAMSLEECSRPLALDQVPLLRVAVISCPDRFLILLTLSHFTVDYWSTVLLCQELISTYGALLRGERPPPRPHVAQQHDLVREELQRLRAGQWEEHHRFWATQWRAMGDAVIRHGELPGSRATTNAPKYQTRVENLSADEAKALIRHITPATEYAFWRTMCLIALAQVTGKNRVAMWANFLNRTGAGRERVVAWCSVPHLIATDVPRSGRWTGLLAEVSKAVRLAQRHQMYSIDSLVLRLGDSVDRSDARVFFDLLLTRRSLGSGPLRAIEAPGVVRGADLDIRVCWAHSGYSLVATFDASRYASDGVSFLLKTMHEVTRLCLGSLHRDLADIALSLKSAAG